MSTHVVYPMWLRERGEFVLPAPSDALDPRVHGGWRFIKYSQYRHTMDTINKNTFHSIDTSSIIRHNAASICGSWMRLLHRHTPRTERVNYASAGVIWVRCHLVAPKSGRSMPCYSVDGPGVELPGATASHYIQINPGPLATLSAN